MLRRAVTPRRALGAYELAVREVVGAPGRRPVDALALIWAHQIAWAEHRSPLLKELDLLAAAAERYDLALDDVLAEQRNQQQAPAVVPAARSDAAGVLRRPA